MQDNDKLDGDGGSTKRSARVLQEYITALINSYGKKSSTPNEILISLFFQIANTRFAAKAGDGKLLDSLCERSYFKKFEDSSYILHSPELFHLFENPPKSEIQEFVNDLGYATKNGDPTKDHNYLDPQLEDFAKRMIGISFLQYKFCRGFSVSDTIAVIQEIEKICLSSSAGKIQQIIEYLQKEKRDVSYIKFIHESLNRKDSFILPMRIEGHRFYIVFKFDAEKYSITVANGGKGASIASFARKRELATVENPIFTYSVTIEEAKLYSKMLIEEVLNQDLDDEATQKKVEGGFLPSNVTKSSPSLLQIIPNCPIFNLITALGIFYDWTKEQAKAFNLTILSKTFPEFKSFQEKAVGKDFKNLLDISEIAAAGMLEELKEK